MQLVKKYERGDIAKSDWLDKLAFRKMEEIHAAETTKSENLFLYIDMPRFDFPVVFSELASPSQRGISALYSTTTGSTSGEHVNSAFCGFSSSHSDHRTSLLGQRSSWIVLMGRHLLLADRRP
jgi:phosphatidylinositol 3-kinase